MKVAVTGCAGFLGYHLSLALLKEGHEVAGIDDLSGGDNRIAQSSSWSCFLGRDVRNTHGLVDVFKDCEVVWHCACIPCEGLSVFSPRLVVDSVVNGSVSVMSAAVQAGVKRVVNCSSMARYGDTFEVPYREPMLPHPVDPYGLAKFQAEQQMHLIGSIHGVRVVHAVPHNIVGPFQKHDDPYRNVASIFANRVLQGKPPIIYGDGGQVRCFSHVDDVVPVLLRLGLDQDVEHGEVFNVGPDEGEITVKELAMLVMGLFGKHLEPIFMPGRPQEIRHATCSSKKIRMRFGFKQKVSLNDAVKSVVDHVKSVGTKPFDYRLPIEIRSEKTPQTWTKELM